MRNGYEVNLINVAVPKAVGGQPLTLAALKSLGDNASQFEAALTHAADALGILTPATEQGGRLARARGPRTPYAPGCWP